MIGYCCINQTLRKTHTVNRTMRKKTFQEKGLQYVGELVYSNVSDLIEILKWNVENGILLYRMSSDMFPWMTEYQIQQLPNFNDIKNKLEQAGNYIKENKMRVSFHPGPFNVLGSQKENVVRKTIIELVRHSQIMDLMGLDQNTYYPINIHVACTKPSKEIIAENFCRNFELLEEGTQKRLVVENDDKESQYGPLELFDLIYEKIAIPLTFDQFHFTCSNKQYSEQQQLKEALELSLLTWETKPLTHHSSSKRLESGDEKIKETAHSDYILDRIIDFGYDFDTELEAKAKELAVLDYFQKFQESI